MPSRLQRPLFLSAAFALLALAACNRAPETAAAPQAPASTQPFEEDYGEFYARQAILQAGVSLLSCSAYN